jgi:putative ABC transport system permease protein
MTRSERFDVARTALLAHRLRSALSIIGIVAGVATVITAFAIGEGARRQAMREIGALGIRNIYAFPAASTPHALRLDVVTAIEAIAGVESVTAVRHVAAEAGTVVGVSPSARSILNLRVREGRWLVEGDRTRRVAVLGADVARLHEIGGTIDIAGTPFVIVGTLDSQSRSVSGKFDPAGSVFVPLEAMSLKTDATDTGVSATAVIVSAREGNDVDAVGARLRHRLNRTGVDAASVELVLPRALLTARVRSQRAFRVMLLAVGTLALFISGVGILNIMLASVTERTGEIGVRRAFGATRRDILRQFAVESIVLCAAGGLAGIPLGLGASWLVASAGAWPVAVSLPAVLVALAMSTGTGVLFGLYPARRAARITPVDAIRAGLS